MTEAWRNAISMGVRKAWRDPDKAVAWAQAIAQAHDDPIHRADMRERFADRIKIGSRREKAGEYE